MESAVEVALLRQEVHQMSSVFSKLDIAIEKIGEVSNNITRMLAVHEEKISHHDKMGRELYRVIDRRQDEGQEAEKAVHTRITAIKKELSMEFEEAEKRIMTAITELKHVVLEQKKDTDEKLQKNSDRITRLENWKFLVIGASAILGAILSQGIPAVVGVFVGK